MRYVNQSIIYRGHFALMTSQNLTQPMQNLCAHKLRVLADPTRLSVLELLRERPRHVGEINTVLQLEQSLLSHHLKILRNEGFVSSIRDGKAVLYHLASDVRLQNGAKGINLGCCILSFSNP